MADYLRVQGAGEIVRSALAIYRQHFVPLVTIYAPWALPSVLLAFIPSALWAREGLVVLFSIFGVVPLTVAVSDICLGNRPSVLHSYRAFSKQLFRLLLTYLLLVVLLGLGFVLLIIPGVIFVAWYMLVLPTALLERSSAMGALQRSKALGRGFYLRNVFILVFVNFVFVFGAAFVAFVVGLIIAVSFRAVSLTEKDAETVARTIGGLLGLIVGPVPLITTILVYYDMRVRKEAYNSTMLAEDLMR